MINPLFARLFYDMMNNMKTLLTYLSARIQSVSPLAQPVFLGVFAATILITILMPGGFVLGPTLLSFVVMIYADPDRVVPAGAGLILSPIDGYITGTAENTALPIEFDQNKTQADDFTRISFRLSFRGCRTVRAHATGTIREILRFTPEPTPEKSSYSWTRMDGIAILIEDSTGDETALVLSGALIPDQIRLTIKVGDTVMAGDKIGMILFFGTGDLYVPTATPLLRTSTHHLMAGETVIQAASFPYAPHFRTA